MHHVTGIVLRSGAVLTLAVAGSAFAVVLLLLIARTIVKTGRR